MIGGSSNTLVFTLLGKDRVSPAMDSAGKSTDRTGRSFKALKLFAVGAGVAAGVAILKFGKDSASAATEAEESQKKLAFAFAQFPRLANISQAALMKLNTELALKTKHDDDSIASGQAVLAQFRLTGTQVAQVTPLILDYASRMGVDVPTAAQQVGRALMGNTRALKNIGINYKSTGSQTQDFANITTLMREKIGGFAEAEGKTAAGQAAILKNQFGELQETVGGKLIPALVWLTSRALGLVAATAAAAGVFAPFGRKLREVAGDAKDRLGPAMQQLGKWITTTVIPAVDKLWQGGLTQARSAFVRVTAALRENEPAFRRVGQAALQLGVWIGKQVAPVVVFLGENALPVLSKSVAGLITGVGKATKFLQAHTTTVKVLAGIIGALFIPHWVALGIAATTSGVKQVAAWVMSSTASTRSAATHSISMGRIVAGWVLMGAKAVRSGATTAAVWGLYRLDAAKSAVAHTRAAGRIVAGWVLMAVQSMRNAGRIAASWFIALGPVGWAIGVLVLLGLGFIALWKKSETFRRIVTGVWQGVKSAMSSAWTGVIQPTFGFLGNAFRTAGTWASNFSRSVGAAWSSIRTSFISGVRTVVSVFLGMVGNILQGQARAFGWIPGIGGKLRSAAQSFNSFRDGVNRSLDGIADETVRVAVNYAGVIRAQTSSGGGHAPERFAGGGQVYGPGTTTNDRAGLFRLSRSEWVIRAASALKYGAQAMKSVNEGTATIIPGMAAGGGVQLGTRLPGAATLRTVSSGLAQVIGKQVARVVAASGFSPGLAGVVSWLRSQTGKPYIWGGVGPRGYDCSGYVSAAINRAFGRNPHRRLGATGSMPWSMMAPGSGPFMIGWFKGNPGHTAGTINGVNFESRGGRGTVIGSAARGARSSLFTNRMRIKGFAQGGQVGDAPFDLVSKRGKSFIGAKMLQAIFGRSGVLFARNGGILRPGGFAFNETKYPEHVLNGQQMRERVGDSIDYNRLAAALANIEHRLYIDGKEIDARAEVVAKREDKKVVRDLRTGRR